MVKLNITVNGKPIAREVEPRTHLADFIREDLALTGTHIGCEHGICGACTVVINGEIARSCITYAVACEGAEIRTIEGFDDDALMARLRRAFAEEHALQCGYCTPGMLVAARDLIRRKGGLSEREIRIEMSGNLCRCTGYMGIVRAIARTMAEREKFLDKLEPPARYLGPAPGLLGAPAPSSAAGGPSPQRVVAPAKAAAPGPRPVAARPAASGADRPGADGYTRLTQTIRVAHSRALLWDYMADIEALASCMPGARLDGPAQDGHVSGSMAVKLGPIHAQFAGEATVARIAAEYRGVIEGQGRDSKSASRARGRVEYRLAEEGPATTRVEVTIAYALTGPLAQFGRSGLVKDLVGQLADRFARNLEARLSAPAGAAATESRLEAGSLLWAVIRARLKAFFRRLRRRR